MANDELFNATLKAFIQSDSMDNDTKCICENILVDNGVFDAYRDNSVTMVFGMDSDMDYYNVNGALERG